MVEEKKLLPLGISDFRTLIKENYIYVDKTKYIETLENRGVYINFMRPRRFGKSLFTSMLKYYYDANYADDFEELFGNTYIGSHRTKKQGTYHVMSFSFAGLNTSGDEDALRLSFLQKMRDSLTDFSEANGLEVMPSYNDSYMPGNVMSSYLKAISRKIDKPIYIIIDEYDHFANEILGFQEAMFSNVVAKTGFVRKWYEAIKDETATGLVQRVFMTGVSPLTLDSVTSGFNITTALTTELRFNEMMGFTETELRSLMQTVLTEEVYESQGDEIFETMKRYYDGYLFNKNGRNRIFNSNMCLYYLKSYEQDGMPPEQLLDISVVSDYSKLTGLFSLKNRASNHDVLRGILSGVPQTLTITPSFNLQKETLTEDEFKSILFYLGFLTIAEPYGERVITDVPNYVIKGLYFKYFYSVLQETAKFKTDVSKIEDGLSSIGMKGDNSQFVQNIETVLSSMSDKDYMQFSEKYVKLIALTQCMLSEAFMVKTEFEVERGRIDFALLPRPAVTMNYYAVFELKYIKKADYQAKGDAVVEEKRNEAFEQIQKYSDSRELASFTNLKKWILVFAGEKCVVNEDIQ